MIDSLAAVAAAWKSLPETVRNFMVSAVAGVATDLFGSKISQRRKRFEATYEAGMRGFAASLAEADGKPLWENMPRPEVRGLLLGILESRSLDGHGPQTEFLAEALGLNPDKESEDFRSLLEAVATFRICFETTAAEGADPLLWLLYIRFQELNSRKDVDPGTDDIQKVRRKYLQHLTDEFKRLTFKGYTKGKAISIPLVDIFTSPEFIPDWEPATVPGRRKGWVSEFNEPGPDPQAATACTIHQLLQCRLAVVTGGPGAGKSTLLKYLALSLAAGQLTENRDGVLPVIFPVSAYAEKRRNAGGVVFNIRIFLEDYWREQFVEGAGPLFDAYCRQGRALFLIDGLDEVADEGERQKMIDDLRRFIFSTLEGDRLANRFYVTCRTASYEGSSQFEQIGHHHFRRFEMKRFDMPRIRHFLFNWYLWYERDLHGRTRNCAQRAEARRDEMAAVLEGNGNILDLATNPLMLTILALIEHEGGRMPNGRAELYGECLRILSGAWENLRSMWKREKTDFKLGGRRITDEMVVDFLGPVAFEMHDAARREVDQAELVEALARAFGRRESDPGMARDLALDFVEIMRKQSGLLDIVKPRTFGFLHQTFREYLAARWLADYADDVRTLGPRLLQPEWQEVVCLMAASLSPKEASRFIDKLLDPGSERYRHLRLAGACVLDVGRDLIFDQTYNRIIDALKGFLHQERSPEHKNRAGNILGRLGDNRLGVGLDADGLPQIEWVEVSGEPFIMGAQKEDDPEAYSGGAIIFTCKLLDGKPYRISKYPITVDQYRAFVRDGGYQDDTCWLDIPAGLAWRDEKGIKSPVDYGASFGIGNHPQVGISWYEAFAFCRWLSLRMGIEISMPTEAHWERVARGTKGRKFPWGSEFDAAKCNCWETGIMATSAVGIFTGGCAQEGGKGIVDLSGNVWEWCRTKWLGNYNDYEDRVDDAQEGDHRRVLRGGGFNYGRQFVSASFRLFSYPGDRDYNVGFRVVSPVSDGETSSRQP